MRRSPAAVSRRRTISRICLESADTGCFRLFLDVRYQSGTVDSTAISPAQFAGTAGKGGSNEKLTVDRISNRNGRKTGNTSARRKRSNGERYLRK